MAKGKIKSEKYFVLSQEIDDYLSKARNAVSEAYNKGLIKKIKKELSQLRIRESVINTLEMRISQLRRSDLINPTRLSAEPLEKDFDNLPEFPWYHDEAHSLAESLEKYLKKGKYDGIIQMIGVLQKFIYYVGKAIIKEKERRKIDILFY